jgi:hypothetical protein
MSEDTKRTTAAANEAAGAKPDIQDAIRIAEEVEKQRKATPVIMGGGQVVIRPKSLISRHAKSQGGQDAKGGRHFFFVPERDIKEWAYQGARPELDKGNLVRNDSDVLVSTSTEQYRRTLSESQARDVAGRTLKAQQDEKEAAGIAKDAKVQLHEPGTAGYKESLAEAGVK